MKIEILFEDDNYVVLNKPSGLVVHYDGKTEEPSLADWVVSKYPETENVGEALELSDGRLIKRPGIVHRLDRETSGVIVIARNDRAYGSLKRQFKKRKVQKTYRAFVYGRVKNDSGVIDRPIGRSKKFGIWSAGRSLRGKIREAVTEYRVLNRGTEATLLELRPRTGRTHQIRVHLKAMNYPVVCDKAYSPKTKCILGFERLALHAEKIEFNGLDGVKIEVKADCPPDFKEAQVRLQSVA